MQLTFGSLTLSNIRPVKAISNGNAFNKLGRLVLRASSSSGMVKIWEAANADHAVFLKKMSEHPGLSRHLPRVVAVVGSFLATEWVEGEPLTDLGNRGGSEHLAAMAELLAAFHRTDFADLGAPQFDYWADLIRPRFLRAAVIVGHESLANEAVMTVDQHLSTAPRRLSHPDLTRSNLVRSQSRILVSIDNELAGLSGMPFMDVLNASKSLSGPAAAQYCRAYLAQSPGTEMPPLPILRSFWLAREGGASFVAGNVARVAQLFERFGKEEDILPLQVCG